MRSQIDSLVARRRDPAKASTRSGNPSPASTTRVNATHTSIRVSKQQEGRTMGVGVRKDGTGSRMRRVRIPGQSTRYAPLPFSFTTRERFLTETTAANIIATCDAPPSPCAPRMIYVLSGWRLVKNASPCLLSMTHESIVP
jgi:hypothetical protein